MSYHSRLLKAFKNAPVLLLNSCDRYVIISDCHRGNGSANDNFLKNQNIYSTALQYYYQYGFTYIELGDGDELWENRHMQGILETYSPIFQMLSKFYLSNRLYMLYGNHDMEKKNSGHQKKYYSKYFCYETQSTQELFPGINFYEGIILKSPSRDTSLYLTHGHQVSFLNSTLWRFTRFLVRYFWKPLEHFGISDPTSAAKNHAYKDKAEKRLIKYSYMTKSRLITGHTHRPRLNPSEPGYMNTGSCVHPGCITCLEIENNTIFLVKWCFSVKKDRTLYVSREILSQMPL